MAGQAAIDGMLQTVGSCLNTSFRSWPPAAYSFTVAVTPPSKSSPSVQQVAILKRKRPRPPLTPLDRFFWTILRQVWTRWTDALIIVKPETFGARQK